MFFTGLEKVGIVHDMPGRIRLKAPVLGNPALDATLVESGLEQIKGVKSVRVNQKAKTAVVSFDKNTDVRGDVLDVLSAFSHTVFNAEEELQNSPDLINVYWAGTMWILKLFLPQGLRRPLTYLGAAPILMEGIETLFTRGLKVEVLDAAVISMLLARKDYFTAGSITFLLNLGHYLEESAEYRSDKMLKSLIKPEVEYVWVVRGQSEEKTAVCDLQIGDMVRAGSGEMIPVDGKVASGEGLVNQASVTGESLPVHIKPGDYVYSGTVMAEGKIIIEAEKVGSETTTARIAKFISNSLKNKSRTEVKAFAAADKMVPVTFAAGLATLLITRDFRRASSVLSVDYSCALQLVTPTAIKASMFNAATEGIFIKGAQALENLAEIDTIIFDKTGTLTKGMLSVTEVQPYNGYNENEIVRIAASAEEYYSHPIASAVVKEAENRGLKTEQTGEVDFIIAHGVSAYVGGKNVLVGSHHFVAEDEKVVCCFADEDARKMRTKGQTILYVAIDGKLCGLIALKDTLRDESAQVIKELKKHGVKKTVMLTGDHRDSALHVAELLGIDEVYYEMKPEDKAGIVKQLKNQGCRIAFAGDGVNDAPALLTADVGISLPQGADLAKETAAVILLREDLMGIVKARVLAVKTMKVIRQMFRFNIGVNTATVALSLMGRISPLASALLHNGTTLSTLIYALSLSSYGVKRKKEK